MFALAALLVGLCLLEEGEGLSNSGSSHSAGATLNFRNAVGILTDQLALGLGAVGFMAFPIASGFFANGFAFRLGSLAMSNTVRLLANSNAFRAVEHFATFIRALNLTLWFFTLDITDGILGFSATGVTFRGFANRVANGGTVRIVTFPGTLRMALIFYYITNYFSLHESAGHSR